MVVATQEVFAHTERLVETWDLGAVTPERTLVTQGTRFGVSLTNSPGITGNVATRILGRFSVSLAKAAGVGNDKATAIGANAAGVAVDGTWEFTGITGVTTATTQGTVIYVNAGALTTTASGGTKIGVVNYPATYVKAAGKAPVKIGV